MVGFVEMYSHEKDIENELSIKDYYTLTETAHHLSRLSGEDIDVADVMRLSLDCQLKLSVILDGSPAKLYTCAGTGGEQQITKKYFMGIETIVDSDIVYLKNNIYDLSMKGGERLNVEYCLKILSGINSLMYECLSGTYVEDINGQVYQLQERISDTFKSNNFFNNIFHSNEPNEILGFDFENKSCFSAEDKNFRNIFDNKEKSIEVDQVSGEAIQISSGISDYWRPAGCLPNNCKFVVRKSALNEFKHKYLAKYSGKQKKSNNKDSVTKSYGCDEKKKFTVRKETFDKEEVADQAIIVASAESVARKTGILNLPETGLLRLFQIIGDPEAGIPAIIPVSRATWYKGIKEGRFPEPIRISKRASGWRVEDIRSLLEISPKNNVESQ